MRVLTRIIATAWAGAVFAAGAQSAYRWTDITPAFGGNSDRSHSQVSEIGIHPLDGNRLIITGGFWPRGQVDPTTYAVMYSDDGGQTWNPSVSPLLPSFVDSMFVPAGLPGVVYLTAASRFGGFMAGPPREGHLYRSGDFGRTWSVIRTMAVGESFYTFASDPLDAHGIYALHRELYLDARFIGFPLASRNPGIMRTHNDGLTWSAPFASPAGSYYYLTGPTPSAPTRLFIGLFESDGANVNVGAGGIFVSVDSGATWSRADTGSLPLKSIGPDPLRANVLYGHRHAYADERLLRSDDGGTTWRQIFFSASTAPNLSIDPAHPNVLWMPYRTDTIYRSEDRGETWHEVPYPFQDLPPNYDPGAVLVPSPAGSGVVYLLRFGRLYRGEPVSPPDPVVVEYQYEGDRYWLTSLDGEAVSQDYRQQPGNVHRTGLRWGAWRAGDAPTGAVGSCRFWSRLESGLRTRVLVLQGFECEDLKRNPNWILEAENEFYAVPPVSGACASGQVPVRRFNNLKPDVNHRWASDDATAAEMRGRGWYDEGVRFCARPLRSNE
jgi:photosystem II stability/assembly factor-like uncharacterized protein